MTDCTYFLTKTKRFAQNNRFVNTTVRNYDYLNFEVHFKETREFNKIVLKSYFAVKNLLLITHVA